MNKNKIFIITGALFFGLFIALLFWLQTMEGQPNDLQNSYQIEIFNCSSIAQNKTDLKNELNAALHSTGSDKDGLQICHIPILKIKDVSFGIPIYGMNYFRLGMNTDMYLYEDRKADETTFFEAADKNEKYLELQKIASKGWFKNEPKVILDWSNNRNEFIIYPSQKEKHSKNKKVWKSFLGLRGHIDSLIKIDKSEKNIKVYYYCGSIIDPMLDDDGDGIINSKDSCPQEKGSIERNGCPPCSDGDKDGICDTVDKCPNVRGVKACDGCPCPPPIVEPDDDKDGIQNSKDACPNDFGFLRYKGCPIPDKDKDGIPDDKDKCPDLFGITKNKGCPEIVKDGKKQILSWSRIVKNGTNTNGIKFSIKDLKLSDKVEIAVIKGKKELKRFELKDDEKKLSQYYFIGNYYKKLVSKNTATIEVILVFYLNKTEIYQSPIFTIYCDR